MLLILVYMMARAICRVVEDQMACIVDSKRRGYRLTKDLKRGILLVRRKTVHQHRSLETKEAIPFPSTDSAIHDDYHQQHADMPNYPFLFPGNTYQTSIYIDIAQTLRT
jgi:hypothetical protein